MKKSQLRKLIQQAINEQKQLRQPGIRPDKKLKCQETCYCTKGQYSIYPCCPGTCNSEGCCNQGEAEEMDNKIWEQLPRPPKGRGHTKFTDRLNTQSDSDGPPMPGSGGWSCDTNVISCDTEVDCGICNNSWDNIFFSCTQCNEYCNNLCTSAGLAE